MKNYLCDLLSWWQKKILYRIMGISQNMFVKDTFSWFWPILWTLHSAKSSPLYKGQCDLVCMVFIILYNLWFWSDSVHDTVAVRSYYLKITEHLSILKIINWENVFFLIFKQYILCFYSTKFLIFHYDLFDILVHHGSLNSLRSPTPITWST